MRRKLNRDQTPIIFPCKRCTKPVITKEYLRYGVERRGGIHCKECLSTIASDRLKALRNSETTEQRSARGRHARSKADCSKGVQKQWDNFRADPEKYASICESKAARMVDVWKRYDDETKNHIVSSLFQSHGKGRSAVSDKLKQKMLEAGIAGFVSEEPFHGFVPDEINHEAKTIVELFGDAYHCNPRKFKNPNVYCNLICKTVGEQWERDRTRIKTLESYGYEVIVIWEYDFLHHPDAEVQRIVTHLSRGENKVVSV